LLASTFLGLLYSCFLIGCVTARQPHEALTGGAGSFLHFFEVRNVNHLFQTGAEGDRTPGLIVANDALSQLSYCPFVAPSLTYIRLVFFFQNSGNQKTQKHESGVL
jgi:hypothetical protein